MTTEQTARSPACPLSAGSPSDTTPYAHYGRMDELLALQHPLSSARTEPGFIIMSQVKELLFKLLHTEFSTARDQLANDLLDDALWTLRRAARVQQVLLVSWETFSVLSPVEFAEFRDVLGSASGFQSAGYRRLEFLLGNKTPRWPRRTGTRRATTRWSASCTSRACTTPRSRCWHAAGCSRRTTPRTGTSPGRTAAARRSRRPGGRSTGTPSAIATCICSPRR